MQTHAPLLPWYVASSLVVCGYSSLLNGKYRSVNVYPSFENWKSSLYRNKTFENIAGKNPAGKISIMLHIDNLSRSNSSIKRKRGWIWTVLYHFLVWWHWHITAHIQTFRFHQTNQIHYIDMIIDHSGHELFRMGNRGWWHFTIIYILRFGNPMLEIIIVCNHKNVIFVTQNLHSAMCSKYFVGLVQQSLQEKLCQQEIQLLRMVEEIRENLL